MIVQEKSYAAICNNCGDMYEESATGYGMWGSEDVIHPEEDGWHVCGDVHYCPDCHKIDDDDNLIIKAVAPIYQVVAPFPNNNDFPVGKKITFEPWPENGGYWEHVVEDCQGRRGWLSHFFDAYPHLFKKIRPLP